MADSMPVTSKGSVRVRFFNWEEARGFWPDLTSSVKQSCSTSEEDIIAMLEHIVPYLPQTAGLLPKWLFFISAVSIFNSAQTYFSGLELTRRVYENKPLETTGLSARTFGTWTLVSAIIRGYGAYYITNPQVYDITLCSYFIAITHFALEWFLFKTAKFGKGLLGPLIVATTSITWMLLQRDYYLA